MSSGLRYDNYIVSWYLNDLSRNQVDVEIILDTKALTDLTDDFALYCFDTSFGNLMFSTLQVYQDGELIPPPDYQPVIRGSSYWVDFPLARQITRGEVTSFSLKFGILNSICSPKAGVIGIQGSWATFFEYNNALIEYDVFVKAELEDSINLRFQPYSNSYTALRTDEMTGFYVPYGPSQINQGNNEKYPTTIVYFTFQERFYSGSLVDCVDPSIFVNPVVIIEESGVMLGIALLIFLSISLFLVLYSLVSGRDEAVFDYRGLFGASFFLPDSRADIVVQPNGVRRTVRALFAGSTTAETNVQIESVNPEVEHTL